MRLHGETIGKGKDIILLHGWGMNLGVWGSLLPIISRSFRVTAIELPGHGQSQCANKITLNSWARACLDIAPKKASWVGWSLGGLLAIEAAHIEQKKIHSLCLIASSPCFCKKIDWQCALKNEIFQTFADNFYVNPEKTLKNFLSLQVKGTKNSQETLRLIHKSLAPRPTPNIEALKTGLKILKDSDLRKKFSDIEIPINFLLGGRDTIVPIDIVENLKILRPSSSFKIIPQAGHAPILSHQEESAKWLVDNCG